MPEQESNEEQGKAAFERMESWIRGLAPSEVTRVVLPLGEVTVLARALAREIAAPEVEAALASLPVGKGKSASRLR